MTRTFFEAKVWFLSHIFISENIFGLHGWFYRKMKDVKHWDWSGALRCFLIVWGSLYCTHILKGVDQICGLDGNTLGGKCCPLLWRSLHVFHAGVITNQIGLNVGTLIWVVNKNAFKCKCVYFRYVPDYLRYLQGSRLTGSFCFLCAWLNAKCVLLLVCVFLTHMGSGYLHLLHHGRICSGKNRYKCVKPRMLGYTWFFFF